MAIYHFSAKMISRSSGRSSVAAAAYRAGLRLEDNRQGLEHDYSNRAGVHHTEIIAPEGTPDSLTDRATLWNSVEMVERRKDAQLAREVTVALPHELSDTQRASLVRSFVQEAFVDRGMIADVSGVASRLSRAICGARPVAGWKMCSSWWLGCGIVLRRIISVQKMLPSILCPV